jgi:hypothetical protein
VGFLSMFVEYAPSAMHELVHDREHGVTPMLAG